MSASQLETASVKPSCATCLFCAMGFTLDFARKRKRGVRQWSRGYVCGIRPPVSYGGPCGLPPTSEDFVCALYTNRETREQPLRFALPEHVSITTAASEVAK